MAEKMSKIKEVHKHGRQLVHQMDQASTHGHEKVRPHALNMHDTNTISFVKLNAVLATPQHVSGWASHDAGAPAQTPKGAQEEGWADLGSSGT